MDIYRIMFFSYLTIANHSLSKYQGLAQAPKVPNLGKSETA